jgi:O-antigen/teichoic acid export membrane protein
MIVGRDVRRYSQQTTIGLIIGGLLLLFIVGDGLIYLIYGSGPAVTGLICMAAGLVPVLIIYGILALMGWIAKRNNDE